MNTPTTPDVSARLMAETLKRIAEGDEPRPLGIRWRADGKPSKLDCCVHDVRLCDTCGNCVADFANAALTGEAS